MRAIRLNQPREFAHIQIDEPAAPGSGQALVRTHRMGICGSDVGGYLGKMPFFKYPRIPGHELPVPYVTPLQIFFRLAKENNLTSVGITGTKGKSTTTTLTARVSRLMERGVPAHRVLQLTFTRRAAAEMLGRAIGNTADRRQKPWGGTFHSIAHRIVAANAASASGPSQFTSRSLTVLVISASRGPTTTRPVLCSSLTT